MVVDECCKQPSSFRTVFSFSLFFPQHLTLLQVFHESRQVLPLFPPQDNQFLKQNSSSYFRSLLYAKKERNVILKVSFY